jgi:hypothetical protein
MRLTPGLLPILAAVTLAAGSGCSSSSGAETLNCEWLAGPDNCWRSTAVSAISCLPPESESGTLSADNSTCTYPGGSAVTFTPPLVLPPPSGGDMSWDFIIIDANGQPCVHYQDSNSGLTLTVGGSQIVSERPAGGLGIAISCPDGKSVRTSNAFNLFNCPDPGLIDLPGLGWSGSSTAMSATLIGTGDTSVPLFDCRTP